MTSFFRKNVLLIIFVVGALPSQPVLAGKVDWAHQNGSISSNGAIVVKSVSSGSYTGTSNPTGSVVNLNQTAVTQPATVIIKNQSINRWSLYYSDRAMGLPGR